MGDDITIGVTEIVNNIEVTAQPNDQVIDINVTDNSDEVTLNVTPNVIEVNINKGSSFARWGSIFGNLTDQIDLTNALFNKADLVDGKVPSYQLPSFVDDVIEVANFAALPTVGEIGKIYITLDNNKIYRWSGSIYIEIASNQAIWGAITGSLINQTDLVNALNAKQDTLVSGTNIKTLEGQSLLGSGNIDLSKSDVGLGNVDNTSDANKPISTATQTALNLKANDSDVVKLTGDQNIRGVKYFLGNQTASTLKLVIADYFDDGFITSDNGMLRLLNGTSELFKLASNGDLTANSFIKSGGTSTQILAADGSVITAGTNITISGGVISASGVLSGSGTIGRIPLFTSSSALGNSSLQEQTNEIQSSKSIFIINSKTSDVGLFVANSSTSNTSSTIQVSTASSSGILINGIGSTGSSNFFVRGNGSGYFAGNVGIGTTSPVELLDVRNTYREPTSGEFTQLLSSTSSQDAGRGGSLGFGGFTSGTSSFTSFSGIKGFKENGDGGNTAGALSFFTRVNGGAIGERMRITSGGNVIVNNLGTGLVYSNAGALTSTNPSDERLKDDITDLQYGLNEILQLRPVSYNWKNDTINQGKQFGFIAQEVQEIMPELISEFTTIEDEEEVVRLGLDKEGIYATLVNAIKELKAEIELLKQK